ncbi:MAG: HD domain-containing protein [Bacteroidota bacterium]|nr:HD domain-containing protein [Bacteroidota bacterium]
MNRLELVRTEIDSILLNQENVNVRPEGYIHLYGVAQNCTLLAVKRGLDVELCTIIGLLHDIYTYKYEYVKDHALLGAVEAENLLRDLEIFTDEEIEIVRNAISHHSDKKTKHDKYSELITDADLLHNSLYMASFEIKHRKRLKKILKGLGIKIKLKKFNEEND